MTPFTMGVAVFACMFGGALGGMFVRRPLPQHHLTKDTEDAVKLGMGVIATMTALVVGLLLASTKSSRDTKGNELRLFSADLVLLDRNLVRYGPETNEARDLLRRYTVYKIDATWSHEASSPAEAQGWRLLEEVQDRLRALAPEDDAQRWIQARALAISGELAQTHWLLLEQEGGSIPAPFLLIVASWLGIIFASYGMFAPRNATVIAALLACSLSIAGAVFLILDMAQPFSGVVRLSIAPVRDALALLGQ